MADRTALVIDGARGLGLSVARALAEADWRLTLTDPEAETAAAIARSLGQSGLGQGGLGQGDLDQGGLGCDPTDATDVDRLARDLGTTPPDLIVLVLNGAGPARASDLTEGADFAALVNGRTLPLYHVARSFGPLLRGRAGAALLTVATLPARPDPWQDAMAGWIAAATRALAAEWAQDGVRVNAVLAARDDTPPLPRFMTAARRPANPAPVPLGRLPQVAEIAATALSLCHDRAAAITGQVLRLDGGRG